MLVKNVFLFPHGPMQSHCFHLRICCVFVFSFSLGYKGNQFHYWTYVSWSKPMVPLWGRCTAHFRTYFSGDWDVHSRYGLLTHGHMFYYFFQGTKTQTEVVRSGSGGLWRAYWAVAWFGSFLGGLGIPGLVWCLELPIFLLGGRTSLLFTGCSHLFFLEESLTNFVAP